MYGSSGSLAIFQKQIAHSVGHPLFTVILFASASSVHMRLGVSRLPVRLGNAFQLVCGDLVA